MKKIIYCLMFLGAFSFTSCQKEGKQGEQGIQGTAGPEATSFNFTLTFPQGSTYQSFSGVTGFESGDVILVFSEYETLGEIFYNQLPALIGSINIIPEFGSETGLVYINTFDGTSNASPWSSATTLNFKAVLIKSSGLAKHPNIESYDYATVKEIFNL